jgi:virginiamycin B lyase
MRSLSSALAVGALTVGTLGWAGAPSSAVSAYTPVGTVQQFTTNISSAAYPFGIAAGPDGALWFTEGDLGKVGRITTDGTVSEYDAGVSGHHLEYIAAGPDGALWFTVNAFPATVGRISVSGQVTTFSDGIRANAFLQGITTGPDGALWFTESGSVNRIGRITTDGIVSEFSTNISPGAEPLAITSGPDGALWFTEPGIDRIGRITTGGSVTEFPGITPSGNPVDITPGPDGALWFTESAGRIGRITTAGAVSEFSQNIGATSSPAGIVAGPDGALWFTESGASHVSRITTAGVVTTFSSGRSMPSAPWSITAGPDGALWFTDNRGRIGRITTGVPGAPTGLLNVPASKALTVTWSAPRDLGSSAITGYTVTATPGGRTCTASAAARTCTVTGLSNKATYRLTVRATNAVGQGPASAAVSAVVGLPRAPRSVTASPLTRAATVRWAAPSSIGMGRVTRYVVVASPGGRACSTTGGLTCTVTGLVDRTRYTFTVTARNAAGVGVASAPSVAITVGAPSAPRALKASFAVAHKVTVVWTAPASLGSGPVKSYLVRWSGDGGRTWSRWFRTGGHRNASRSGLVKHHGYVVQVAVANVLGVGPSSELRFVLPR